MKCVNLWMLLSVMYDVYSNVMWMIPDIVLGVNMTYDRLSVNKICTC